MSHATNLCVPCQGDSRAPAQHLGRDENVMIPCMPPCETTGGQMSVLRNATPERLNAFSDGVFAVLITVLVLELRPPEEATFQALMKLWPTGLSYAVSYLFIAIVWPNHHYLLRYADETTPRLLWFNSLTCFPCRCCHSPRPGWRSAGWRRNRSPSMRQCSSSSTRRILPSSGNWFPPTRFRRACDGSCDTVRLRRSACLLSLRGSR